MTYQTERQDRDSLIDDLLQILLVIVLPPLSVLLEMGPGKHFRLNILLTLLAYIPGIIHAAWIVARR